MKHRRDCFPHFCFCAASFSVDAPGRNLPELIHSGPPRDNTPQVLTPSADGTTVYQNDYASIDASNVSQGYVMVRYSGSCEKVKVQITGPDENTYTYLLSARNDDITFPLPAGDGTYTIQVLENVSGDSYAVSLTQEIDVTLENEFLPFLYPNSTWILLRIPKRLPRAASWRRIRGAIWRLSRIFIISSSKIFLMTRKKQPPSPMDIFRMWTQRWQAARASVLTMQRSWPPCSVPREFPPSWKSAIRGRLPFLDQLLCG